MLMLMLMMMMMMMMMMKDKEDDGDDSIMPQTIGWRLEGGPFTQCLAQLPHGFN